MGLAALAEERVDVDALLSEMTNAVEEIEVLRSSSDEEDVRRCLAERLVSMRALLGLAVQAQEAGRQAISPVQSDLEGRKVMVAAIRQEVLLGLARQCLPVELVVVSADCLECPDEDPTGNPEEDVILGPIQQVDEEDVAPEPDSVSPFQ
jgi:hypothetical protein